MLMTCKRAVVLHMIYSPISNGLTLFVYIAIYGHANIIIEY